MLNPVAFSCYKNLNLQKCEDSERTESRKLENKRKEVLTWQDRKTKTGKRRSNFFGFRRLNEEYRNCGSLGD